MANDYTQLNQGSGGDVMDETGVDYPEGPTRRKRPRIVLAGEGLDEFAEVKNAEPSSDDFGLVTRALPPVSPHPGYAIAEYAEVTLVPIDSETTVVTYTVPNGETFYFAGFHASGDVNGRFILYINGVQKFQARSTPADLNVYVEIESVRLEAAEGQEVRLSIIHGLSLQPNFNGTILGYAVEN